MRRTAWTRTRSPNRQGVALAVLLAAAAAACGGRDALRGTGGSPGGGGGGASGSGGAGRGGGAGNGGVAGNGGTGAIGGVGGNGGGGGIGGAGGGGGIGGVGGGGGVGGTGGIAGAGRGGVGGAGGPGGAGGSGGAAVDAGLDAPVATGGSRADAGGDAAGEQAWIRQFGSKMNDEAQAVTVDGSGNVYVAGHVGGALEGQTSAGSADAFVRKYDRSGSELWTRQFGSAAADYVFSVSVDGGGNVLLAGWTVGALPGQIHAGARDVLLKKYDGGGSELWTRQFGTAGDDFGLSVAVGPSGDVYLAGYTDGTLPGQSSAAGVDTFLRKYDGSGNELWTRQFGSADDDYGQSVCVDGSGNVYLAGYTSGALPGRTSAGAQDAFVRKYDGSGAELWTRQFGSGARDIGRSVSVDGSGSVYIGGYTEGVLDANRNPIDMMTEVFVKKYDGSGEERWTRQFGWNGRHYGQSVSVDGRGGVYVVGYTDNLGPNAGVLARKYDGSGAEQWTRTLGSTSGERAYAASVDGSGNVYVAGYTSRVLAGQSSAGLQDAFVQMLRQ